MSTPAPNPGSFPQYPQQLAVPSSVVLSYGDLVQFVNSSGVWIGPGTSFGGGSHQQAPVTQTTSQSLAQAFMVVNAAGAVTLDTNSLPTPVLWGDIVQFAAYPGTSGLIGYTDVLDGCCSTLVVSQGSLGNKYAQWQLNPFTGFTGPTGSPIPVPANQIAMANVGSSRDKWYYENVGGNDWKTESSPNHYFQIHVVNQFCGQIADCPTGYACFAGKCYPNQPAPYSQGDNETWNGTNFMTSVFNQICSPNTSLYSNNLAQPFCYDTCSAQTPNAQGSGARGTCDSWYAQYCGQVWGVAGQNSVANIPTGEDVCSCTQAAANNIVNPQCYWPFCANKAYNNYQTSAQAISPPCSATCVQIFNCGTADQGQCNIAQNSFSQNCGAASGSACVAPNNACQPGLTCINGTCQTPPPQPCSSSNPCAAGQTCNSQGKCVPQTACVTNSNCTTIDPAMVCIQGQCGLPECTSNSGCNAPATCNMTTYTCQTACTDGSNFGCPGNYICQGGYCVPPPTPAPPNKLLEFLKENWKWFAIGGGGLILLIVVLVVMSRVTKKKPTTQ